MAFSFLPRDDYFFTAFPALAAAVQQAAALLERLLDGGPADGTVMQEIDAAKEATDGASRELINRLSRTFVTPFDREDIHRLAQSLVAVTHSLCDAAMLISIHDSINKPASARKLAALVRAEVDQLVTAMADLQHPKNLSVPIAAVRRLDDEVEAARRGAVAELLDSGGATVEIIRWKDVLDSLQQAANSCEEAIDVLEGMAVKS